jgi:hypothetical protein
MIFTSLQDRLKQLKRPFYSAIKRLVWRGAQALKQMEQRYTKESAVSLKDQIKGLTDRNDLSGEKVEETIKKRHEALDRRLSPLYQAANGNATLIGQLNGIKTRVQGKLNTVKAKFTALLGKLKITDKAKIIKATHHVKFQALADQFYKAAHISAPTVAVTTKATPKAKVAVKSKPYPKTAIAIKKRTVTPTPIETGRTAAPHERYVVNQEFKSAVYNKIREFSRTWSGETWIEGGPTRNDAITRFTEEFYRNLILTAGATKPNHRGYRGQEAGYAFIADKMGGVNASNPDNPMKVIIKQAYIPFELYGRGRRDTDPKFRKLFKDERAKAYRQLRTEFFKGMKIGIDGKITSQNKRVTELLKKAEKARAKKSKEKKTKLSTSRTPQVEVKRFKKAFAQLKDRGISAARFNHFLERHKDLNKMSMQTYILEMNKIPLNQEIYLDDYDRGLAERFEMDMMRNFQILPVTWSLLPSLYEKIQSTHSAGSITQESFIQSFRNNGTTRYPRIFTRTDGALTYLHQTAGTNVDLGLMAAQNAYVTSSLSGMKQLLKSMASKKISLPSLFDLKNTLHLDRKLTFKENSHFFHFPPRFLQNDLKVKGKTLHMYDVAWNNAKGGYRGRASSWKADVETQLKAYHVSLSSVANDVSIKDVFDHASQFLAQIESQSITDGATIPNSLEYNIGGVKMSFDKTSSNLPHVKKYLKRVIAANSGASNPKKKQDLAIHLYEKISAAHLNVSPDMILNLLHDRIQPLKMDGKGTAPRAPSSSLDVFDNYFSLIKNASDKYVIRYRGKNQTGIGLDQKIAEEYFHSLSERGTGGL